MYARISDTSLCRTLRQQRRVPGNVNERGCVAKTPMDNVSARAQSNDDQPTGVDALPRLIKQRVVITPPPLLVRKMQMQRESRSRRRPSCAYARTLRVSRHMLRYSAVEFAHTATARGCAPTCARAQAYTHGADDAYTRCHARLATRRRRVVSEGSPVRICANSKSIDHTRGDNIGTIIGRDSARLRGSNTGRGGPVAR